MNAEQASAPNSGGQKGQRSEDAEAAQLANGGAKEALDAFQRQPQLSALLAKLLGQIADPTTLLKPSPEISQSARQSAKVGVACGLTVQSRPNVRSLRVHG